MQEDVGAAVVGRDETKPACAEPFHLARRHIWDFHSYENCPLHFCQRLFANATGIGYLQLVGKFHSR